MNKIARTLTLLALPAALAVIAACSDEESGAPAATLNPADFRSVVDNPFLPLSSLGPQVFEGEETDPDTGETIAIRVESRTLPGTDTVAGVEVLVAEVKDYEDGELVELTLDYYAQHSDGTVYYFGERVDEYEDGKVVGHTGAWLAGKDGAEPGVFMPADPQVGDKFEQEKAPGIAEDRSEVLAVGQAITTAAGSFDGCIKTEDYAPIDDVTEFKFYCPDAGLVREEFEDGRLDLISY